MKTKKKVTKKSKTFGKHAMNLALFRGNVKK